MSRQDLTRRLAKLEAAHAPPSGRFDYTRPFHRIVDFAQTIHSKLPLGVPCSVSCSGQAAAFTFAMPPACIV